jgi:hypothetical protein
MWNPSDFAGSAGELLGPAELEGPAELGGSWGLPTVQHWPRDHQTCILGHGGEASPRNELLGEGVVKTRLWGARSDPGSFDSQCGGVVMTPSVIPNVRTATPGTGRPAFEDGKVVQTLCNCILHDALRMSDPVGFESGPSYLLVLFVLFALPHELAHLLLMGPTPNSSKQVLQQAPRLLLTPMFDPAL